MREALTEWYDGKCGFCGKWGHNKRADCRSDGEYGYCGKWGHKRADCRRKTYDEKGKGKGASAASAAADGPSVGAVTYEDWNMEPKARQLGVRRVGRARCLQCRNPWRESSHPRRLCLE